MNEADAESIEKIRGIVEFVIAGFVLYEKSEEKMFIAISYLNPETGLYNGYTELKSESGIVCKLTIQGLETEDELLTELNQLEAKAIRAYIAVHNVLSNEIVPEDYPESVRRIFREADNE
jgi:hypothetical protein